MSIFTNVWEISQAYTHSQQCTHSLPIKSLPNALLITCYLCKISNFSEKYKNVTYSKMLKVKAELVTFLSAYIKNFIESTLKIAIMEHIYCIIFYLFHECLSGGGYRFSILEEMTHHLEVEETWEQHKTPWRSRPSLDEKESPWRQMDLMLPKVLSLERNIHTSS